MRFQCITKLSLTFQYKLGSLTPVVLDIARQHTYAQFRHVVHSSLQHSVGWEQIALYFYLTRTAVHVAKGSVSVAQMAYQYFRETYSGWVEERGGWVSLVCYTPSNFTDIVSISTSFIYFYIETKCNVNELRIGLIVVFLSTVSSCMK